MCPWEAVGDLPAQRFQRCPLRSLMVTPEPCEALGVAAWAQFISLYNGHSGASRKLGGGRKGLMDVEHTLPGPPTASPSPASWRRPLWVPVSEFEGNSGACAVQPGAPQPQAGPGTEEETPPRGVCLGRPSRLPSAIFVSERVFFFLKCFY